MSGERRKALANDVRSYVEEEGAKLLREYARAGAELAADGRLAREKTTTDAWRRVTEQSRLAGQIARAISVEADSLRAEFRSWQSSATPDYSLVRHDDGSLRRRPTHADTARQRVITPHAIRFPAPPAGSVW